MMVSVMKRLLAAATLVLILFLASRPLLAQETYENGLKRGKAENKHLVVYFFSKYCPYCTKMDKEVLADKEMDGTLKKDFVFIRVDVDKKPGIAQKFSIRGYPTLTFLDPGGNDLGQIPGYIPKNDFKKLLTYVKGQHYKTTSFSDFASGKKK
jgi:thioredoxin-related protein